MERKRKRQKAPVSLPGAPKALGKIKMSRARIPRVKVAKPKTPPEFKLGNVKPAGSARKRKPD